ncbi:MAG: type IV toxin-antitoxin system AbiEi family antitoxin domain-containing protein [Candidatus Aminicenantales bacterium]
MTSPIDVRNRIPAEIFDYQNLTDALKELSSPRDKITDMLRQGVIIRIKKGLYIFGDKFRRCPYSKELLANLVYGPSYVSLDYALAYYGLIPERVEALTSVTPSRPRRFSTPVGLFVYRRIPAGAYEAGMARVEVEHDQAFLIATPEKALADKIVSVRGPRIASIGEMGRFLDEDLRIDPGTIRSLSAERVDEFAGRYRSLRLRRLGGYLRRLQRSREVTPNE